MSHTKQMHIHNSENVGSHIKWIFPWTRVSLQISLTFIVKQQTYRNLFTIAFLISSHVLSALHFQLREQCVLLFETSAVGMASFFSPESSVFYFFSWKLGAPFWNFYWMRYNAPGCNKIIFFLLRLMILFSYPVFSTWLAILLRLQCKHATCISHTSELNTTGWRSREKIPQHEMLHARKYTTIRPEVKLWDK